MLPIRGLRPFSSDARRGRWQAAKISHVPPSSIWSTSPAHVSIATSTPHTLPLLSRAPDRLRSTYSSPLPAHAHPGRQSSSCSAAIQSRQGLPGGPHVIVAPAAPWGPLRALPRDRLGMPDPRLSTCASVGPRWCRSTHASPPDGA
jgi:hypothetical protein